MTPHRRVTVDHLSCNVYELRYCIKCTNISKVLAEALTEDTPNNFKWTCNGCKQNFPCMTSLTNQLKSIEEKNDSRICQIVNKLQNINESVDQKVKSFIIDVTPILVDKIKKISELVYRMMSEKKLTRDCFLCQHVKSPTRYRDGERPNTLGLIMTNEENMIDSVTQSAPLGKSDHKILEYQLTT